MAIDSNKILENNFNNYFPNYGINFCNICKTFQISLFAQIKSSIMLPSQIISLNHYKTDLPHGGKR